MVALIITHPRLLSCRCSFDFWKRNSAIGTLLWHTIFAATVLLALPGGPAGGIFIAAEILLELHGEALEEVLHALQLSLLALVLCIVMVTYTIRLGLTRPIVEDAKHEVGCDLFVDSIL